MDSNLIFKFIDFPTKVGACITPNEDDTYTIFINSRLSIQQQAKALKHELKHYFNNDLHKMDINEV